ncbi:zinc-binding dehydrogenase [Nocardioides caeni]|uniref:Zinc-binding dehydrogenase n=1 Tax=Nocardioides caeni TaxID=574700 RepID=A0A4S8NPQ0_9ACTN|nr:zinc-binding dehydrogenase [Nocardioides caeni]THV18411.1 hypothetical protein E9934_01930 [Nocardioides caeni]
MRAIRHHAFGPPDVLQVEELPDPDRAVVDVLGAPIMSRLAEFERAALAAAADGSRTPYVGTTFPLAEAASAHRALEEGRSVGKVVLLVGSVSGLAR